MAANPTFKTPVIAQPTGELRGKMEGMWSDPPGLYGWLGTTDHKKIGKR